MRPHAVLILLLLSIDMVCFAQSNLTIFSVDGDNFLLFINGDRINDSPAASVEAKGLSGEGCKAKIVFSNAAIPEISKHLMLASGEEATFGVKRTDKGTYALRLVSTSPISKDLSVTTSIDTAEERLSGSGSINGAGTTDIPQASTAYPGGQIASNGYSSAGEKKSEPMIHPLHCTMSQKDYQAAIESVRAKSRSAKKMSTAKQAVKNRCVTIDQIKEFIKLFDSEDQKLEFAKHAYHLTRDKDSYYLIGDVFENELSMQELHEYIRSKK